MIARILGSLLIVAVLTAGTPGRAVAGTASFTAEPSNGSDQHAAPKPKKAKKVKKAAKPKAPKLKKVKRGKKKGKKTASAPAHS